MQKKTLFTTYRNYCKGVKNEIILNSLHHDTRWMVGDVAVYLQTIYNLDYKDSVKYVLEYFDTEKYLIFEEPVKVVWLAYKNSFN